MRFSLLLKVGYNIAPKMDTPLSEMLALGLERYVDELTEISSQASKEYALEKVMLFLTNKLTLSLRAFIIVKGICGGRDY